MKAFINKENKSGYLGILFTLVFGFVFSTMFTPFIGIPVALFAGYIIHNVEDNEEE